VSQLAGLKIRNLSGIWENDSIAYTSGNVLECFENSPGYRGAFRYVSSKYNMVAVSVFTSKEDALAAMTTRRNDLPGIYSEGDSLLPGRTWWYTDNRLAGYYSAYVSCLNTLIEVHYYYKDFEEGRMLVLQTAEELAGRVERLAD
jgi:hypothetical protein